MIYLLIRLLWGGVYFPSTREERNFMSEKYIILADVTADISQEIRDYFQIPDYIKGHIHFSDGRDFRTTLDWSNINREDFYNALTNRKLEVNTAPASPEEYYQIFRKYVEDGYKILSMNISSKISSTYNVACVAAKRVMDEIPQADIYCFDSYRMSGALGLLLIYAQTLQNEGKSYQEVIQWLEENKHRVHQMGPIDDLIFIARRGRVTMGKAIMGTFAGVKPMGDCNNDGYVSVLSKVKGINKALDITVQYAKRMATDIQNQYIVISHSNRAAYAEKLKELAENSLGAKKVFVTDVFTGCGTNIGPGMIAMYFMGNPISPDLTAEKSTINEILGG